MGSQPIGPESITPINDPTQNPTPTSNRSSIEGPVPVQPLNPLPPAPPFPKLRRSQRSRHLSIKLRDYVCKTVKDSTFLTINSSCILP